MVEQRLSILDTNPRKGDEATIMSDTTPTPTNPETRIALFQRKEIRRAIHNNEWWFVITDVVAALTDSTDPLQYLKRMRQRDPQLNEAFKGGVQIVPPLALPFTTAGGQQNFGDLGTYTLNILYTSDLQIIKRF